jgi:predicted nucleotidyltransferase
MGARMASVLVPPVYVHQDGTRLRSLEAFRSGLALPRSLLLDGAAVVGAAWLTVTAMDFLTHPTVLRVLDRARREPAVLAVILFGSHARGEASAASDVDLCFVLASDSISNLEISRIRLVYLGEGAADVVIFHQLPLHVKSRVLSRRAESSPVMRTPCTAWRSGPRVPSRASATGTAPISTRWPVVDTGS